MGEANVLLSSGFNAAATDDVIWRQPGGKAESRSASSWLRWRPEVSAENLLLACSLYFVLVACRPFWHALLAHRAGDAISLAYVLAVGIGLTGVHFLLFAPLLARWTIKPLLASLIVVSASASYFAGQFGVYFDPDMLRNVVRTDIPEARELLGPSLFAHVLAIALPALVVLQRVRVR
ncbi:MAG: DUF1705 domain-containing protein, partial [Candidatus Contendobacter sp.]|nr:DUF1705 domain-containing protein [Candidatus Contendobacter sp.]